MSETLSKTRVLIIEDDPHVRAILVEILNRAGFAVSEAHDGELGYEQARRNKPDLILCDVGLGNLDGYNVLRMIREGEVTRHVPFIFLTGAESPESRRTGLELGADDYLTKPFSVDELLDIIKTRLQRQKALQEHYERILRSFAGRMSDAILEPLREITGHSADLRHQWRQMRPSDIEALLAIIERQSQMIEDLTRVEVNRAMTPVTEYDPPPLD